MGGRLRLRSIPTQHLPDRPALVRGGLSHVPRRNGSKMCNILHGNYDFEHIINGNYDFEHIINGNYEFEHIINGNHDFEHIIHGISMVYIEINY